MGLFDRVWVPCPDCGEPVEFQSKAGDCLMDNYSLTNAPLAILEDISHDYEGCEKCRTIIGIKLVTIGQVKRRYE